MRRIGSLTAIRGVLAASLAVSPVVAETVYDQDGVQLSATMQRVQSGAAVCRVLAENETLSTYEELKPNDGQPLDIWRVEVVVANNSGRVMDDLRVFFPFDSERPPCTNWEESPGVGFYSTGGVWIQFQKGRGGVQPGEDVREAKQLLVFHTDQPSFGGVPWRIHYEFAPGPAVEPPAADADSPRAGSAGVPLDDQAGVHGQAAAFDPAETCEGKAEGAECWHQLDSHPGCYVWNSGLKAESTASWTGACNGSVAEGEGVLTWAYPEGASVFEGVVVGGKQHGRGSYTSGDGTVAEGTYANGLRSGRWRATYADGTVAEGVYANGRRAGRWVTRQADGTVVETPYVNGEIHGTMVVRFDSGTVRETPWVNGEKHGTEVRRYAGGTVVETPYVNGEIHGTQVRRLADGTVNHEKPYVNGKLHGTEVLRFDSLVTETPWVNGQRHGTEVTFNDGRVFEETPWVNGKIHGTNVIRNEDGSVFAEMTYVNGELLPEARERPFSGRRCEQPRPPARPA